MALDQWSQFLKDTRLASSYPVCSKSVRFASGLVLSVQASKTHMCNPRENDPAEGWYGFEVYAYVSVTLFDQRLMGMHNPESVDLIQPISDVSIKQLDAVAENNGGIAGCAPDAWEDDDD